MATEYTAIGVSKDTKAQFLRSKPDGFTHDGWLSHLIDCYQLGDEARASSQGDR